MIVFFARIALRSSLFTSPNVSKMSISGLSFLEEKLDHALIRAGTRANYHHDQQKQLERRGLNVCGKLQNCLTEAVIKHVEQAQASSPNIKKLILDAIETLGFNFELWNAQDESLDIRDYEHFPNFVSFFSSFLITSNFNFLPLRKCYL